MFKSLYKISTLSEFGFCMLFLWLLSLLGLLLLWVVAFCLLLGNPRNVGVQLCGRCRIWLSLMLAFGLLLGVCLWVCVGFGLFLLFRIVGCLGGSLLAVSKVNFAYNLDRLGLT